jgi:hypothetical protein
MNCVHDQITVDNLLGQDVFMQFHIYAIITFVFSPCWCRYLKIFYAISAFL